MQAQSLSELFVECGSANVLTLAEEQLSYEGMLSIENPDHDILKKPVVYHSHFTKKRKIIFLAKGYKYLYKLVLHIIYVITLCTGILLLKWFHTAWLVRNQCTKIMCIINLLMQYMVICLKTV